MRETKLCRYTFDPLDRLVGILPLTDAESQRFYCKSLLATEIRGTLTYSIFQHEERHLAQQQRNGEAVETSLLATDQQRSIMLMRNGDRPVSIIFTPYGHCSSGLLSLLAFNGERRDPVTGHYLLGNGYRAFNPVLMRFNSPDNLSPFGDGGLNPYTYCMGDPVNQNDPTGHLIFSSILHFLGTSARRNLVARPLSPTRAIARVPISSPALDISAIPSGRIAPRSMNNRPASGGLNIQHQSRRRGSLDSVTSTSSISSSESHSSSISVGSLGSNNSISSLGSSSSISSYGSNSSTATATSGSRRASISSDSDWSGSGRRNDGGWGSNESLSRVPTLDSGLERRVRFHPTIETVDTHGNVSYDHASTRQISRIRHGRSR